MGLGINRHVTYYQTNFHYRFYQLFTSFSCTSLCCFKLLEDANAFSHIFHLYGLIPVWILSWRIKLETYQMLFLNLLISLWIRYELMLIYKSIYLCKCHPSIFKVSFKRLQFIMNSGMLLQWTYLCKTLITFISKYINSYDLPFKRSFVLLMLPIVIISILFLSESHAASLFLTFKKHVWRFLLLNCLKFFNLMLILDSTYKDDLKTKLGISVFLLEV